MKKYLDQNIGEIVADDFRTAQVFSRFGIDFCCKGNRRLTEVCEQNALDPSQILKELEAVETERVDSLQDFNTWPLDVLADYIVKKHHHYVEKQIPVLKQYLAKIVKVHGQHHPELKEIMALFEVSAGEFTAHMKKEELILFPFIKKLEMANREETPIAKPHFGTVSNPIEMMMREHEDEGERFEKMSELSQGFTPPVDACNTYKVTYDLLKDFEEDLHTHIHLENNILFPQAAVLEKKWVQ
ncbi:iron-sulfur cluster repair di-iron protein [Flavobacteriaceae bacterium F08102]|nr:iron-sulfur cluster repair di-iron protein [Flavobacteriaceae bacterium F08102]